MSLEIVASCRGKEPEVVDTVETEEEAAYLLREYRLAFGPAFTVEARPGEAREER